MSTDGSMNPGQIAARIRSALPEQGLFQGHEWRVGTRPFVLDRKVWRELESLGRVLLQFYNSLNLLHRWSTSGRMPRWVAADLDRGKPDDLLTLQREVRFKNDVPRVIRPDVLITEQGMAISELDSVPGGVGLTAWLNQAYAAEGFDVVGGAEGMLDGFAGIFDADRHVNIAVSEEAATYRPEMEWLVERLNERGGQFSVRETDWADWSNGDAVYRFFELFDLPNIGCAKALAEAALSGDVDLTPPFKPLFEEKLAFALLWNRNLEEFWTSQLGRGFFNRLRKLVPRTWTIDPTPLPHHAAIPELDITDWHHLKLLSQRERELILKVSGFSEQAWGARGVHLGSDLSTADWSAAVDEAIRSFSSNPFILQRFAKPMLVEAEWFDFEKEAVVEMRGRVRLCPYYFVHGKGDAARANLGGVLATVCPADKKIIHGMRDAVIVPCMVG